MMKRDDEGGFVSLFTCILISLLLLVVTLSLISLEALQLRKAQDAEQTLRAYYTAESGVEDAVSKVLSGSVNADQTCGALGSSKTDYDIPGAAGWTCQQISFSGTPFGKLDTADEAKTVDPGTGLSYRSVIVQWNQSDNTNAAFYNMPATLPNGATGATNYAPPVELSIIEYPTGGFSAAQIGTLVKTQNALIVPGGTGAPAVINYGVPLAGQGQLRGNCGVRTRALPPAMILGMATGYNCYAVINNLDADPTKNFIFRIRSRYSPSAYRMVFKANPNGNGAEVQVPDGTATIDVTARAGQTYRRVISKLPLNNGAAAGLNYVMYADDNICKNFHVINNVADSPPGC